MYQTTTCRHGLLHVTTLTKLPVTIAFLWLKTLTKQCNHGICCLLSVPDYHFYESESPKEQVCFANTFCYESESTKGQVCFANTFFYETAISCLDFVLSTRFLTNMNQQSDTLILQHVFVRNLNQQRAIFFFQHVFVRNYTEHAFSQNAKK